MAKILGEGFTLVELLIVIVIISIVAAFAFPLLLRNRMAANEASAQSSLDAYYKTQQTFYLNRSAIVSGFAYWTQDIAGLYYLSNDGTNPIGDLDKSVADSDYKFTCTAPAGYTYKGCSAGAFAPYQKSGYYVAAATKYNGTAITTPKSSAEFGMLAAPQEYDVTGNNAFIVNKKGEKFKSETAGKSASDIFGSDYNNWSDITYPIGGTANPVGKSWTSVGK